MFGVAPIRLKGQNIENVPIQENVGMTSFFIRVSLTVLYQQYKKRKITQELTNSTVKHLSFLLIGTNGYLMRGIDFKAERGTTGHFLNFGSKIQ